MTISNERWLEFHDSRLIASVTSRERTRLELDGYIHQWDGVGSSRRGTGWIQRVTLDVDEAVVDGTFPPLPCELWTGRVIAEFPENEDGTLLLPIAIRVATVLELTTMSGATVRVSGTGFSAAASGEARFVEEIPSDMDPHRAG